MGVWKTEGVIDAEIDQEKNYFIIIRLPIYYGRFLSTVKLDRLID